LFAAPRKVCTAIDAEAIDAAVLDVNLNGQMSYPIADALAERGAIRLFDRL